MVFSISKNFRRLSIKLLLEMNFIVLLSIIAAAVFLSVSALLILQSTEESVSQASLPTITAAYDLAHEADSVLTSAPRLVLTTTENEQTPIVNQMREHFDLLSRQLHSLAAKGLVPLTPTLTRIQEAKAKLEDMLVTLQAEVAQRNRSRRDLETLVGDARRLRETLLARTGALAGAVPDVRLVALENLIRQATSVLLATPAASLSGDGDRHRADFLRTLDTLGQLVNQLETGQRAPFGTLISDLRRLGSGDGDLFQLTTTLRTSELATKTLLNSYLEAGLHLHDLAHRLIDDVQIDIGTAFESGIGKFELQAWTVVLLSLLAFFAAAVFSLMVVSSISQRMESLKSAMDDAAQGGNIVVDMDGDDELSGMAKALHGFVEARNLAEERERKAREEAERASASKTRFLAAASHDLRQPLQALTLFLTVLDDETSTRQQKNLVGKTLQSVESLRAILDRVLDISKLEAGLINAERNPCTLSTLFRRLDSEFSALAESKELRFRSIGCSAVVDTDPSILDTILRNLLSNAFKFTRSGRVVLGARRRPGRIEIQVWDTGIGIPSEKLDSVFEEFFQIGNEERNRQKGLGLGLSIVQRLSVLIDARISVRSEPGKYTVFSVCVPLARSTEVSPLASPTAMPAGTPIGAHVLLVEDDVDVADATTALLESWGCRVSAFSCVLDQDGLDKELVDLESPPDLIIADYRLPHDHTGASAVQFLRTCYGADIPAVLITGDTNPERLSDAMASNIPVLHKPIDPVELGREIQRLLDLGGPQQDLETHSSSA